MSLIRKEYLSSAVSVLRSSPKIFHITKRESCPNSVAFTVIKKYGKVAGLQISTVFGTNYYVWKCLKFDLNSKSGEKNWEKVSCYLDICIWIGCVKLSWTRREYLSSAVNVLPNSPKILYTAIREMLQLNCFHSDQEIWQRCRSSSFNSVWDCLPCRFSKDLLKRNALDTCLTTSFAVCNLGNTWAMRVILVWKCSKFNVDLKNGEKSWEKVFCL